jgi:uncharacterized membrane protein YkoI
MNPFRKAAVGAALVGSTLVGGAFGAALLNGSATAATTATTAADQSTAATGTATQAATDPAARPARDPSKGGHMANGVTEALLIGDTAEKVKAAALAAVPGGTIQRVENDAEGAAYEAHMTKADGSEATVKLDSAFKVTSVEDGHR